ncbi:MAG TPA: glycoside hydrolase family 13 protein, partial [Micromonosporaceae bacterium]|nr:glycoside hydrolase family 13 protein [Micromonosporaceae bacterium]
MSTGYHHDGSALYVPNQAPELGDPVTVFVRGPVSSGVERVYVRSTPDGEPLFSRATVHRERHGEVWWRATVRVHNPVTRYRF